MALQKKNTLQIEVFSFFFQFLTISCSSSIPCYDIRPTSTPRRTEDLVSAIAYFSCWLVLFVYMTSLTKINNESTIALLMTILIQFLFVIFECIPVFYVKNNLFKLHMENNVLKVGL